MILACFAFGIIILNDPKMKIPFANPEEMVVFVDPQFGWSWYLTLFTGIGVLILGGVVLALDFFVPRKIAAVFHHSIVEEDEFFAVSEILFTFIAFKLFFSSDYSQEEFEEEEETGKPSLEEYGASVRTRATRRGGTTRTGRTTQRRGLSRYRQTQRKPRSTIRSNRGGSQRLNDDIQLEEISPKET